MLYSGRTFIGEWPARSFTKPYRSRGRRMLSAWFTALSSSNVAATLNIVEFSLLVKYCGFRWRSAMCTQWCAARSPANERTPQANAHGFGRKIVSKCRLLLSSPKLVCTRCPELAHAVTIMLAVLPRLLLCDRRNASFHLQHVSACLMTPNNDGQSYQGKLSKLFF